MPGFGPLPVLPAIEALEAAAAPRRMTSAARVSCSRCTGTFKPAGLTRGRSGVRTASHMRMASVTKRVSADGVLVPLDPGTGTVGNLDHAARNLEGLRQDWIGPILPLKPVRGLGDAK